MAKRIEELKVPDFILSNNPMEEYNAQDWIYCPKYLSLVLVIAADDVTVLLNEETRKKPRKTFYHNLEEFELVVVQNNVLVTGGEFAPEISETEFLENVWKWYEKYLFWEDDNLNEIKNTELN